MLYTKEALRKQLYRTLTAMYEHGSDTQRKLGELAELPDSYDVLVAFAESLSKVALRSDWRYTEPNDWEGIVRELASPPAATAITSDEAQRRIRAAFTASVCGCVLGKPLEVGPTMDELKTAFAAVGQWPIDDYVSVEALQALGRRHMSWPTTCRENIRFAAADDDINYSIIGMLVLERYGLNFTHQELMQVWGESLPVLYTFGAERLALLRACGQRDEDCADFEEHWADTANGSDEYCGAMIRVDAYGYACAGDPMRAAKLAWCDATMTHRRTGVYGAMFAAAAIAAAFTAQQPMDIFKTALRCVPERSRFYEAVSEAIELVEQSTSFLGAYETIHRRFGDYGHCRIYQETATLINAVCYASDSGDGICKQIMQGNDTDSYGCLAGGILGAYFGEEGLNARWYEPFGDNIELAVAKAPVHTISGLAERMAALVKLAMQ